MLPSFPRLADDLLRERYRLGDDIVDVVIDTDVTNEIDDQFAIVHAFGRADRMKVHASYACPWGLDPDLLASGTMMTDLDHRNVEVTLASLGIGFDQIPRILPGDGMERAFDELGMLYRLLGHDGSTAIHRGSDRYLPDASTAVVSDAAEHMIEASKASDAPLYVLAIGCATNVASALLLDPTIVERIVVVWTSAYPTFWPHANVSFNMAQDVAAAQVLFASGVPHVYLPGYYVGEELRVSLPEMAEHLAGKGPVGDYLYGIYDKHPLTGDHHGRSKVLWDLINVAWVIDPTWLDMRETESPLLGDDLCWQPQAAGTLISEAVDISRDAVMTDFYRVIDEMAVSPSSPPRSG